MTGIGADTSLLIDFFKGDKGAVAFMRVNRNRMMLSEMVMYEFLCGLEDPSWIIEACAGLHKVPFDMAAAQKAAEVYRKSLAKGKRASHQDAMVAGSYIAAGISKIATRDTKFPGMQVMPY